MRDKLIKIAIEKFGKRGFDAVGTREIAAAADTPMSSITYHFGGKEGLYNAAGEHTLDFLHDRIAPGPDGFADADASDDERIAAIIAMLRRLGLFMLSDESAPFALFISREQQDPSDQLLALMEQKIRPMMELVAGHVVIARPDLNKPQARAVTLYLFGMAITLRHSRASLGMMMEGREIEPEVQAMLLDQLEQSAAAILKGSGQ